MHTAEANIWHNQAGPGVEFKEGGKACQNLEEVHKGGTTALVQQKKQQEQPEFVDAALSTPFAPPRGYTVFNRSVKSVRRSEVERTLSHSLLSWWGIERERLRSELGGQMYSQRRVQNFTDTD